MSAAPKSVAATLLSIGDELLLGQIVDTNQPYLARQLPLGISVHRTETVGDVMEDISAAFQRALAGADIVLATGGLGPTADDLTAEALARALGVPLEFRAEVMEQMAARLHRPVAELPPSNRKQALVPQGARVLRNDWGTAPGIHCATPDGKHFFLMPGVPREMFGILGAHVLPFLKAQFPDAPRILVKELHSFGIPESLVGERLKPFMQAGCNPDVGTRVKGGVVTVRLVARGATDTDAQAALAPVLAETRAALREGLFSEDEETLAEATAQALLTRGKTVALAESCTAGLASSLLADVPGISAALLEGVIVYSNDAKLRECGVKPETLAARGAVSAETAAELAAGIRARAGSDIGVSVTGIAGPSGGTATKPVGLVYFGVATARGVQIHERRYPGTERNFIRERAAMQALDFIRRAAKDN